MPATPSAQKPISTSLLSFTPRQVLLTNHSNTMKQSSSNSKLLLHQSIARYLERSGFSKSLKKFRSEAQIEKDSLEGSTIDLEEMCLKYLEICGKGAKSNIGDHNEQVDGVHSENKEEGKSKEKKKKKNKSVSESPAIVEDNPLEPQTTVTDKKGKDKPETIVNGEETEKKSKDKKKKKDKTQRDTLEKNGNSDENISEEDNIKASNKEVTDQEKNDSKKRKRPISEENGEQVADKKEDEDTKRRKTENLDDSKGVEKLTKTSESAAEKSNGHLESTAEKSSTQKSQKKQQKESAEKTAKKAFQRVQVDKVQFADERLQDNSYWAKDGADSGYGAKAEEILGQVRGRDFRHEKTKKKRGSYRGGQIDLQSHSVKFNYSDEE